jgi:hypothetical protein
MIRVVVESPLNAPTREGIEDNKRYARRCVLDSLLRGEAPYASHLFFDQEGILDDRIPSQREMGMKAGFVWGREAQLVAVYTDRGISKGMTAGIDHYRHLGIPIEYRQIDYIGEPKTWNSPSHETT